MKLPLFWLTFNLIDSGSVIIYRIDVMWNLTTLSVDRVLDRLQQTTLRPGSSRDSWASMLSCAVSSTRKPVVSKHSMSEYLPHQQHHLSTMFAFSFFSKLRQVVGVLSTWEGRKLRAHHRFGKTNTSEGRAGERGVPTSKFASAFSVNSRNLS